MKIWLLLAVLPGLYAVGANADVRGPARQESVYFLAVGSSRYLPPEHPADHGFSNLDGARNGALMLADRLKRGGANYGISLTSPAGSPVALTDVNRAFDDVVSRIRRDNSANPILLVYIASHGISDGFAWNHFSVPGDFTYRGDPSKLPADRLALYTIHAADLVDKLDRSHVHFVLLLDSCYDGKAAEFDSPVLTSIASQSIGSIANALRYLNEFHEENPVLFSTEPGTRVAVAPDPTDPENNVGPLARRLILLIDKSEAEHRNVSVAKLVEWLLSATSDSATRPAVTHAEAASWWKNDIVRTGARIGIEEDRKGTARHARVCCS
jgi:hypothetical protein